MTADERIGFNLRRLREHRSVSRTDLARAALVERSALSLHERGRKALRLPELRRLAAVLDVTFEDFAEGVTWDGERDEYVVEEP